MPEIITREIPEVAEKNTLTKTNNNLKVYSTLLA